MSNITNYRAIYTIANEIRRDWVKPNFGAVPYLEAMSCLDGMKDNYGCDPAESIVAYFLANAGTWKGETAKRIKLELKAMLAGKSVK
jgi:hypothetical protein